MSDNKKRKNGRPTIYRESIVKAICIRLSIGESLNAIVKLDGYPKKTTIFRWLHEKKEFRDKYQHAREMQQEHYLDEIIEIADDGTNDYVTKEGKNGEYEAVDSEHIARSRLRVDTRKWVMERMAARKYAPRSQVDNISTDGSMSPTYSDEKYKAAQDKMKGKGLD